MDPNLCKQCHENPRMSDRKLCKPCFLEQKKSHWHTVAKFKVGRRPMSDEDKKKLAEHNALQKQQNPEAYAAKRKSSYLRSKIKRREAVFTKLGLECQCCGESDIRFLTVEHKLNNGSEDRKIRSHEKLYRDILKMDESTMHEQFESLCMQCNFAKGRYKVCPHREADNG